MTTPEPAGRTRRALARARKSRARTRRVLLRTTFLTGLGVIGFFALFWRPSSPGPGGREIDAGAPELAGAAEPRAPVVTLRGGRVLLDGVDVGTTEPIAQSGRLTRLDGLYQALRRRWIERDRHERAVVLDVAADVPAIVVKSAFQTAAFAGYTDVSFALGDASVP